MDSSARRERVSFTSHGTTCAGYLYRPPARSGDGALPCVVLGHGFSGTMDKLYDRAERFSAAGMAALVFDYRGFGASDGEPRQVLDIPAQLDDWRAAIGFARSQKDIDPARIALWGSSLSGGHVINLAADDPEIAAVIAQVPWLGDGRPAGRKLRHALRWNSIRLTVAAIRDARRARRGQPPLLVPVVGPAGSGAMFTEREAFLSLEERGSGDNLWRNEFAPRIVFSLAVYEPRTAMPKVTMPLLVCTAQRDLDIPASFVDDAVAQARQGTVRRYPGGHFALYLGDVYQQVIKDQIEFLTRHLFPGR